MHLLYPSDPFDPKSVEELYLAEYSAARAAGFSASLFSVEDFEMGEFRPRPAIPGGATVMLRSWMLTVPRYSQLVAALEARGAQGLTSVDEYQLCHHLPCWYPALESFTAETVLLPEAAEFESALAEHDWPGYFVKDYVKSVSTAGGAIAERPSDISRIVATMKQYRGEIEGGLCIRKREEYEPDSEQRYFVLKGRPFSADEVVPSIVSTCAERIASPFFSVDIARRTDGTLRIIELGDGQVSDRKEWTAEQVVRMLESVTGD